jgi:hypothetical protein
MYLLRIPHSGRILLIAKDLQYYYIIKLRRRGKAGIVRLNIGIKRSKYVPASFGSPFN